MVINFISVSSLKPIQLLTSNSEYLARSSVNTIVFRYFYKFFSRFLTRTIKAIILSGKKIKIRRELSFYSFAPALDWSRPKTASLVILNASKTAKNVIIFCYLFIQWITTNLSCKYILDYVKIMALLLMCNNLYYRRKAQDKILDFW